MNGPDEEVERRYFERWAGDWDFSRSESGAYANQTVQDLWCGWIARAAKETQHKTAVASP